MKRLNRKGFTLVELLAVIVILAIVVGITLVTVLPTLKKSRQEAFNLTAQTAADYFEKQYQLYVVGDLGGDTLEIDFSNGNLSGDMTDYYSKAGLKATNYSAGTWEIVEGTGRACVTLTRSTASGTDYYDANDDNGYGAGVAKSTGCNE